MVLSILLSVYLADAKWGVYKVLKVGMVLLFIHTVLNCWLLVIGNLFWNNQVLTWIQFCSFSSVFVIGCTSCILTLFPLGLDQMPDASSSSVTSYISWFVFSLFLGRVFSEIINILEMSCSVNLQILSLLFALLSGILLISVFIYGSRWIVIEPKSQSLKNIYLILKFAIKHKAPLNRSAFTYWKDDTPSRLDLGKSRYGGPFSTEQIEDVRTVFRIFKIGLPISCVAFGLAMLLYTSIPEETAPSLTECATHLVYLFTHSSAWCGIVGTLVYEFILYPFFRKRSPPILRKIGVISLIATCVGFLGFILQLAHFFSDGNSQNIVFNWISLVLCHVMSGLLMMTFLTSLLEFICAQSPYNLRGIAIFLIVSLVLSSSLIGLNISYIFSHKICQEKWCPLVSLSLKTLICLVGFILYCVMARRYKCRVREEDFSSQRYIEEVYERCLFEAPHQSYPNGMLTS